MNKMSQTITTKQISDFVNWIMKTEAWRNDGALKLYLYCLANASHNEYEWYGHHLHPGDLPLSERHVSEALGWSRNKLRRKMTLLKNMGLITVQSSRGLIASPVPSKVKPIRKRTNPAVILSADWIGLKTAPHRLRISPIITSIKTKAGSQRHTTHMTRIAHMLTPKGTVTEQNQTDSMRFGGPILNTEGRAAGRPQRLWQKPWKKARPLTASALLSKWTSFHRTGRSTTVSISPAS